MLRILKNYMLREIPQTRFMDFGLLCENDKGEYVVLNDVRMAYIRLASLVYLLVYVSTYCVPIAHLRQNKPFPLLYLGHAQIMTSRKLAEGQLSSCGSEETQQNGQIVHTYVKNLQKYSWIDVNFLEYLPKT